MADPTIADAICASLRTYGMQPEVSAEGSLVTITCGGRQATFNPADAPVRIYHRIEWLHDRLRELLPDGWAPPRLMPNNTTKETS